jgi:hypothetical protein
LSALRLDSSEDGDWAKIGTHISEEKNKTAQVRRLRMSIQVP